ncbi:MAG: hypothetical protein WB564_04870 [Dehalococcoidia bacterium]
MSTSYVGNRFPLSISQFISKHEDKIRTKKPYDLFGWSEIVCGQNVNLEEIAE